MANLMRRVFIHNIGLKIVSLLLAIGLWAALARDPIAYVEMKVPIEFQNFPNNLEIDSANFTEAQVRIKGPAREIHQLQVSDVHAEINLAKVQPGVRTFDLSDRVHVPQDLEVEQIIPDQFQLTFDERATRKIEVRPVVTGKFASSLRVAQMIADPPTVTITGPRRRVEAIEAATTDPIDASGTSNRATFATHAYVSDPVIQVAHPTSIRVTVIMESSGEEKK